MNKENLLGIFYRGVQNEVRRALDIASKGSFASLNVEQAETLIDNFAQSDSFSGGDYERGLRKDVASLDKGKSNEDLLRELSREIERRVCDEFDKLEKMFVNGQTQASRINNIQQDLPQQWNQHGEYYNPSPNQESSPNPYQTCYNNFGSYNQPRGNFSNPQWYQQLPQEGCYMDEDPNMVIEALRAENCALTERDTAHDEGMVEEEESFIEEVVEEVEPVMKVVEEKGASSELVQESSVEHESMRIANEFVQALSSPLMGEAIKGYFLVSKLAKDLEPKEEVYEEVVQPLFKDKNPKELTSKEKDALFEARKSLKSLGIHVEKGKDLNQVKVQLEVAKSILANKEKVEELVETYDSTMPTRQVLKRDFELTISEESPIYTANEAKNNRISMVKDAKEDVVHPIAETNLITYSVNKAKLDAEIKSEENPEPPISKRTKRRQRSKAKKKMVASTEEIKETPILPVAIPHIFKPVAFEDGKLVCKVKATKGSRKPFGIVRIILDAVDEDGNGGSITAKMIKTFGMFFGDPGPNSRDGPPPSDH